ncbi:MAG: outer membrane protein transport protein, partial [Ignavibacteria bacterium]
VTHPLLGTIALPQGEVTAPLTLPQNLQAGIAYHLNEKLTLAADFQYTGWSSYDKLEITFTEANVVSSAARDYENNFAIRGGFEYQSSKQLAIRGGLYYDKNPIKDEVVEPTLPDNDRIGFAGGVGIGLAENINLDLGYLFLLMGDREITDSEFDFNGTYSTTVHLFAVNLTLGL